MRSALGAGIVALALIPTLAGCSLLNLNLKPVQRDDAGAITEQAQAGVAEIAVGDCMDSTSDEVVFDVPVVPCDQAHDEEIFGEFDLAGSEFPEASALETESNDRCIALFNEFVGFDYFESELDFYTLTPTEEGWNQFNDRTVNCVIVDPAGKVTGSLKGAAR
ncbi:septum formation family protein [Leucobacter albus]|uniref:Septum formation family protein n=1 Tax=Leucobacter albus TaxID=272210 RepID=A0ABW3TV91_9MICO